MASRNLVVDVQILRIGSNMAGYNDDGSSRALLERMAECEASRLVWDDEGHIRHQYEELPPKSFARFWLTKLTSESRVIAVPRARIDKSTQKEIRDTGLVGEDFKYYVRTAVSSPCKRLVSEDTDYDKKTKKTIHKALEVSVLSASEGANYASS